MFFLLLLLFAIIPCQSRESGAGAELLYFRSFFFGAVMESVWFRISWISRLVDVYVFAFCVLRFATGAEYGRGSLLTMYILTARELYY